MVGPLGSALIISMEPSLMRLEPYKEALERSLIPSIMLGHSMKSAVYNAEEGLHQNLARLAL